MVQELIAQCPAEVEQVFAVQEWLNRHEKWLRNARFQVTQVLPAELERISALVTPNMVIAVAKIPVVPLQPQLPSLRTCFYLDGLQDPGNVGTILRIADWFGIPAVYCSSDCADIYSTKVVQSSMGASFRVPSWKTTLDQLITAQPDIPVLGAVMDGVDVFKQKLPATGILVIGNEGGGIRPENDCKLTTRISIPRHPNGKAESLNAAVAAGILAAMIPTT
ncbi:MAG: RNA methyltransferase [Saprospiraceae bacterium]|nr:RNA methyltransferase [Saprospiraceae bacterium]